MVTHCQKWDELFPIYSNAKSRIVHHEEERSSHPGLVHCNVPLLLQTGAVYLASYRVRSDIGRVVTNLGGRIEAGLS